MSHRRWNQCQSKGSYGGGATETDRTRRAPRGDGTGRVRPFHTYHSCAASIGVVPWNTSTITTHTHTHSPSLAFSLSLSLSLLYTHTHTHTHAHTHRYVAAGGGLTGGWSEYDHGVFVRERLRHRSPAAAVTAAAAKLVGHTEAEVAAHETWCVYGCACFIDLNLLCVEQLILLNVS